MVEIHSGVLYLLRWIKSSSAGILVRLNFTGTKYKQPVNLKKYEKHRLVFLGFYDAVLLTLQNPCAQHRSSAYKVNC